MNFNFVEKYSLSRVEYINKFVHYLSNGSKGSRMKELIGEELLSIGIHANKFPVKATVDIQYENRQCTSSMYSIKDEVCVIGRKNTSSIVLPEKTISGMHAKIINRTDGHYLIDLQSLNGTQLNGKFIVPDNEVKLHSGDSIQIGSCTLIFNSHIELQENIPLRIEVKHFHLHSEKTWKRLNIESYVFISCRMKDAREVLYLLIPKYICRIIAHQMLNVYMQEKNKYSGLSEVEMACVEYLIMKICFLLNRLHIPVSFIKAEHSSYEFTNTVIPGRYYYAEIWTTIDGCTDFFPLLMPPLEAGSYMPAERICIPAWLQMIPLVLHIMVGSTSLSCSCVREIGPGDILLLDISMIGSLELKEGVKVRVRIQGINSVGLECSLIAEDSKLFLKIMNFVKGGYHSMDTIQCNESITTGDENNHLSADEFVHDIELTLVCEMSRFQMTIGEVMKLKPEQIIALNKILSDEVIVSLHDKIIGKGRLVDIEGRMGIRITSLMKD